MKLPDQRKTNSGFSSSSTDADGSNASNALWDISRLTTGELSALRRNAGVMMSAASMKSQAAFYRAKNLSCNQWQEEFVFPALCMQSLWRESDVRKKRLFPEMLRDIYQDKDATDSMRRKCTEFLDYAWSEDGFLLGKICRLVRRIRTDNPSVQPDFEAMAIDLSRWNNSNRNIQKKWLRTICWDGSVPAD